MTKIIKIGLFLVVIICSLLGLILVGRWFFADVEYSRGRALGDYGLTEAAIRRLNRAVKLWPWEPAYHRELAGVYAQAAAAVEGEPRSRFLVRAADEANTAFNLNPRNLLTLKSLTATYFALAQTNPVFRAEALSVVAQALVLCPTDPTLWYYQGLVLGDGGELPGARSALDRALQLKPDYVKAQEAKKLMGVL